MQSGASSEGSGKEIIRGAVSISRAVFMLAALSLATLVQPASYADSVEDSVGPSSVAASTETPVTPGPAVPSLVTTPSADTAVAVGEVVPDSVTPVPGVVPVSSLPAADKYLLVSDIDDTIKITNVLDLIDLVYRHWNGNATFAGMSRLYRGLAEKLDKVAYLSGSPESQKSNLIQILFKKDQFPEGTLLLSNWWQWKSTQKFKTEQLEKLALTHQNFILIGDDAERDPVTLSSLQQRHPTFKVRTYIHQIQFAPLPVGVKGFSIPFEVALAELEEGSLSEDAAIQTGEELLKEPGMTRIFPEFKRCPSPATFSLVPGAKGQESKRLVEVASELTLRVREFCAKRGR